MQIQFVTVKYTTWYISISIRAILVLSYLLTSKPTLTIICTTIECELDLRNTRPICDMWQSDINRI